MDDSASRKLPLAILPYQRLVELASDALVVTDFDGTIVFANVEAERLSGWSRADLVGAKVERLVPGALRETHECHRAEFALDPAVRVMGSGRNLVLFRADESTIPVEVALAPIEDSSGRFVLASIRDLTLFARDQKTRLEQQEQLRLQSVALTSAANAVVITDRHGVIRWVNPAFTRMTGYSFEEAVGHTPRILRSGAHPPGFFKNLWETILRGEIWQGETTNRRKSGDLYVEEQTIAPVRDVGGEITHFVAIKLDVTERRRVELALREAKETAEAATRAKSEFLANMSHEIRTPMNGVIGVADLLLGTPLSAGQKDLVETLRQSGESLLAVINDILDFSRVEEGKLEIRTVAFDPVTVASNAVALVVPQAVSKGLEIDFFVDSAIPRALVGDPTRVSQVLLNLLSNAVKFTDEGRILLRVESGPGAAPGAGRTRLRVSVEDTGIGLDPDHRTRLFQPFEQIDASSTRRHGGSGLGLAISRRLAELMGGELVAESEGIPGRGSTFRFVFEAGLDPENPSRRGPLLPEGMAAACILVVSDGFDSAPLLVQQLEAFGFSCVERIAIDGLGSRLSKSSMPDLAILVETAGEEGGLLARLRRAEDGGEAKPIPAIVLSFRGNVGRQEGVVELRRPLHPDRLLGELLALLDPANAPDREIARQPERSVEPLAPRLPLRILLVEDNPVNARLALALLDRLGYSASVARQGAEALEILARTPVDVVLMDIQMPVMDGLEATRRLRATPPAWGRPTVVALTANALGEERERARGAGMDDFLAKPIRLADLAATLERAAGVARNGDTPKPELAAPEVERGEVDERVLDELEVSLEDRELFCDILRTFLESGPVLVSDLGKALAAGDRPTLRRASHTLKSNARMFGALSLGDLCERLEQATGDDWEKEARDLVPRIRGGASALFKRLRLRIGEEGESTPLPLSRLDSLPVHEDVPGRADLVRDAGAIALLVEEIDRAFAALRGAVDGNSSPDVEALGIDIATAARRLGGRRLEALGEMLATTRPEPETFGAILERADRELPALQRALEGLFEGGEEAMSILVVDDDANQRLFVASLLENMGFTKVRLASSGREALQRLGAEGGGVADATPPDLVILDLVMADLDGIETCRRMRAGGFGEIPILMLTASDSIANLEAALDAGVLEYLVKPPKPLELRARVRAALRLKAEGDRRRARERELVEMTRRLAEANARLEELSIQDSLTGLANRRDFDRTFDREWNRACRSGHSLAVAIIDVDFFKLYNDHFGHPEGDACLRAVAEVIRGTLRRSGDLAARYGGEEFALVLPDTGAAGAFEVVEGLRQAIASLERPHPASPVAPVVTVSAGFVAMRPKSGSSAAEFLGAADRALYVAKRSGRNRVEEGDVGT
jgi:diguanylate cyclase (GGDEF)-like protein/PAS domain S-box-containing protein